MKIFGAILIAAMPVMAMAQTPPAGPAMQGGQMPGMQGGQHMPRAGDTPSTKAFKQADAKMHRAMAIRYSGNADRDFASSMIPHHQGAIDMAKIELQYGTDPELRKLAEEIVAAQDKEIAFMKAWQAKQK